VTIEKALGIMPTSLSFSVTGSRPASIFFIFGTLSQNPSKQNAASLYRLQAAVPNWHSPDLDLRPGRALGLAPFPRSSWAQRKDLHLPRRDRPPIAAQAAAERVSMRGAATCAIIATPVQIRTGWPLRAPIPTLSSSKTDGLRHPMQRG
jgi:hypothetical protein